MPDLNDIIEAALSKGRKTIIETNDDDIDDWDPEEGVFRRIDEAKPVKPLKPLKPGETREDAEKAADPNHAENKNKEDADIKRDAEKEATEVEKNAPRDNKNLNKAVDMMKDKTVDTAINAVKNKSVEVAKAALAKKF